MKAHLPTILDISQNLGEKPAFVFRRDSIASAVQCFQQGCRAKTLFAVKTNPEPLALRALFAEGVRSFDVASLAEIELVRRLFGDKAELFFMHPVKSRAAIREAYHRYGVRHFSLDSRDELIKILEETRYAEDLGLHLRLSIPNNYAELNLSEKFGINLQEAPALLKQMNIHAAKLGVCFHTGSQSMHPDAYRIAIQMAGEVIANSEVAVHFFNVGGGFPSIYPGLFPPEMQLYFDAIHEEFDAIEGSQFMTLLAEPGRAMVAESMSLIVRVDARRGNMLYINDGTYGSLFDAGTPRFIFPTRLLRHDAEEASSLVPYSFYGPTCDSLDVMKGPFYLPHDVREGDYIEIGQMGAYGRCMNTGFNGFTVDEQIYEVSDAPLMSMYDDLEPQRRVA